MDDRRVGAAIRTIRLRKRLRQEDVGGAAGVSRSAISRLERGHLGGVTIDTLRAVAGELDIRIDVVARWRAGDLDRLLNARHAALHEELARMFAGLLAWIAQPEVSFSIYGERGVIDILAWHAGPRALLLIEIKTDIVDVNELLGTLDRKRRLARQVAAERGWNALEVGVWLVVAEGTTNRRRVEAHRSVLRSVLPDDGFRVRTWLRDPVGVLAALSFWGPSFGRVPRAGRGQTAGSLPDSQMTNARRPLPPSRRVRRSSATDPERGQAASTHGQAASTPGQAADQGSRPA